MQASDAAQNPTGVDNPDKCSLDAKALRELAPFVILDAIRPGDVMLTRGLGKESKAIASATYQNTTITESAYRYFSSDVLNSKNSFSHAAMFLTTGIADDDGVYRSRPINQLAEADDYGVGFTKLDWIIIHLEERKTITVAKLPKGAVKPLILRHPDLCSVTPQKLMEATELLVKAEFFKDFSSYERLLKPAKLPPRMEKVAAFYLKYQDMRRPKFIRGTFCSELVSTYFSLLNIEIFKSGRKPNYTSPNDLGNQNDCLLRPVEDLGVEIIVDASAIPDNAYGRYVGSNDADRGRSDLPKFVKYRSESEHTISLATMLNQKLEEMNDSSVEMLLKMGLTRLSGVTDGLQRASTLQDKKAIKIFSELAELSVFALELTKEHNASRSNVSDNFASVEQKRFIEYHLFQQIQEIGRNLDKIMLRSSMLMTIRQARLIEHDSLETISRKRKARHLRRNLEKQWIKHNKAMTETDAILEDMMGAVKLDIPSRDVSEMALASAIQRAASKAKLYGAQT